MIHDDVVMVLYDDIYIYTYMCVLMVYSTHISLYIVLGIEFGSFNLGLTFASLSCSRTGIHLRRSKRCVFPPGFGGPLGPSGSLALRHGKWPIEFVDLPIKSGDFS